MPCTSTILTARIAKRILQITCHVPQRKHHHHRMTKLRRIFGNCEAWLVLPFLTDLHMAVTYRKRKSSKKLRDLPKHANQKIAPLGITVLSSKWELGRLRKTKKGSQHPPKKSPSCCLLQLQVHHFAPALLPIPHLRKKATESVVSLCASCSPYLPLQHWPPWPPSCYPPGASP